MDAGRKGKNKPAEFSQPQLYLQGAAGHGAGYWSLELSLSAVICTAGGRNGRRQLRGAETERIRSKHRGRDGANDRGNVFKEPCAVCARRWCPGGSAADERLP